jgi:hypothetical protein
MMIPAVHFPAINYGLHILRVVLDEMATGTLLLMGEAAAMGVAGILRQPPNSSRLPVGLRLIASNRRRTASCPLVPALLGLFTTVLVENPKTNL